MQSRRSTAGKTAGAVLVVAVSIGAVGGIYVFVQNRPPYFEGIHSTVVSQAGDDGPRIGNCPLFPANNVWNTPVDTLKLDERSQAYIDSIGTLKSLHPDFGPMLTLGVPYTDVPAGTGGVAVTFDYRRDSDPGNYPIPVDAPIEGGVRSRSDRHILLVDQERCLLYELYSAEQKADGTWTAGSGIKMDLTSNALRPAGKTSADAAGLPILPGLVRYEEVESGEIKHALRFTVRRTQKAYIWPARHMASKKMDKNLPPMGQRFRLRAEFDISKYSRTNQVILRALQRYGMFLADNGGSMFLSGVADKRWSKWDLRRLRKVKAEDFEAVDESGWQMLPDSARIDPVVLQR